MQAITLHPLYTGDRDAPPSSKRTWGWLLIGFVLVAFGQARAASVTRDVEYGQAGGQSLRLDVSVPEGDGPFPVAILVHGGGWGSGDKGGAPGTGADITPWFGPLTAEKFAWFSVGYRLAPTHRWPACLEDVRTAVRWVKAHAAEFKGDPSRIALVGHSAGGQLAFLCALQASPDLRVQAVVGFAPVTDFEQDLEARGGLSRALQDLHDRPQEVTPEALAILRETSPINHVRAGLPPFLILHGEVDRTVPLVQSQSFQEKVRRHGGLCDLLVLPGAPHRLTEWSRYQPGYEERWVAWLKATLAREALPPD